MTERLISGILAELNVNRDQETGKSEVMLSIEDSVSHLGISRRTFHKRRTVIALRFSEVKGRKYFLLDDLEEFDRQRKLLRKKSSEKSGDTNGVEKSNKQDSNSSIFAGDDQITSLNSKVQREDLDPTQMYLHEISKYPLLKKEEEKQVATDLLDGRLAFQSLRKICKSGVLPPDLQVNLQMVLEDKKYDNLSSDLIDKFKTKEEKKKSAHSLLKKRNKKLKKAINTALKIRLKREKLQVFRYFIDPLIDDMDQGLEAFNELIVKNLRLVVAVAKKRNGKGLEFLDLVQEGNFGLSRALEKFEVTRGFRFSTYAVWWIRQCVGRSIVEKANSIRRPVHINDDIVAIAKTRTSMEEEFQREVSLEEAMVQTKKEGRHFVKQSVRTAMGMGNMVSLDAQISKDGREDTTVGDYVKDPKVDVASEGQRQLFIDQVRGSMDLLTERERKVLELRFGLIDGRARTLGIVGNAFGFTRERARQIESQALAKLRDSKDLRQLVKEM